MTAQINRRAAFTGENGALTQYGWSVIQSIWRVTGGAVAVDVTSYALAPLTLVRTIAGDVGPLGISQAAGGDVGPVTAPVDAMEWE